MINKRTEKEVELQKDLDDALDYISEVVGHNDLRECGVAHLFKKYRAEELAEQYDDDEEE